MGLEPRLELNFVLVALCPVEQQLKPREAECLRRSTKISMKEVSSTISYAILGLPMRNDGYGHSQHKESAVSGMLSR